MTSPDNRDHLSATIHQFGNLLGDVIRAQAGDASFELEERFRRLAKQLHTDPHADPAAIQRAAAELSTDNASVLVKSFSTYFALVNLAEQLQRLWVLRERDARTPDEPRSESIAAAVAELRRRGVSAAQLQHWLDHALIRPVFTAHPTEAKRRTTLEKLQRIADAVERSGAGGISSAERARQEAAISAEIIGLWQSDEVRTVRPTVIDEVKNGLYYYEQTLLELIPQIYRDLERALAEHYPQHAWRVAPLLRFGSWMGGDRDGNPNVTPEVTVETIRLLRAAALNYHMARVTDLSHQLSMSSRQVSISARVGRVLGGRCALLPQDRRGAGAAQPVRALPPEVYLHPPEADQHAGPRRAACAGLVSAAGLHAAQARHVLPPQRRAARGRCGGGRQLARPTAARRSLRGR